MKNDSTISQNASPNRGKLNATFEALPAPIVEEALEDFVNPVLVQTSRKFVAARGAGGIEFGETRAERTGERVHFEVARAVQNGEVAVGVLQKIEVLSDAFFGDFNGDLVDRLVFVSDELADERDGDDHDAVLFDFAFFGGFDVADFRSEFGDEVVAKFGCFASGEHGFGSDLRDGESFVLAKNSCRDCQQECKGEHRRSEAREVRVHLKLKF